MTGPTTPPRSKGQPTPANCRNHEPRPARKRRRPRAVTVACRRKQRRTRAAVDVPAAQLHGKGAASPALLPLHGRETAGRPTGGARDTRVSSEASVRLAWTETPACPRGCCTKGG